MRKTALQQLGEHITSHDFKADSGSIQLIRDSLIDTYGCMLIGAGQTVASKTRQTLIKAGLISDQGVARIYGTGYRASAGAAALANAVSGHALEFDDWEIPGNTHVSVVLVPAILAAASGSPLSGKGFIESYLAGYEVIARIGEAINLEHYDQGWHATATLGAIGAAASVSRLYQLDSVQSVNALAIACSRALGFNAQFGSETKPIQVGFAVEGGIISAQLAANGLTGQAHMLEHPTGLIRLMGHGDISRIESALSNLGQGLAIDSYGIVYKPWPCCGYTHRILTAILQLRASGIDPDSIEHIELHLPDMHAGILPFRQPQNRSEALFSLPYCAAMVLLYGNLTVQDIIDESWHREAVRKLIPRFSIHPFTPARAHLNYDPLEPDRVMVQSQRQKQCFEAPYPLGSPQQPMSSAQHFKKFQLNAGLDDDAAATTWDRLQAWPDSDNIHELLQDT